MEGSSIGKGLGCIAVLPAGFIGLAGLTDGIGPTGLPNCSDGSQSVRLQVTA
jgi:hypothetical protein